MYLLCIAAVGFPILVAEIYIGRESQANAVTAFETLDKKGTPWRFAGLLGLVSAFLILSFYSVVGGWVLDFEYKSLFNQFAGHSDDEIKGYLGSLFGDPTRMIMWHTIFMFTTVAIVAGGISKGIERASKILMPILFVILIVLMIRVMFMDGFGPAVAFLFSPDFSKLTWPGLLEAVGHSFFTLSLGMGAMITYGSYLKKDESVIKTGLTVAILDTVVALSAGLVIFAVVFTFGQEPGAGPTLMFVNLPLLFKEMTGGYIVSVGFFLLVAFAAWTSAISLLEVVVAYWDESHGWNRKKTAIVMGVSIYALGILCALSFNVLSEVVIWKFNFFDLFDTLTSKIFLPLGGMIIALYYGWVLGPKAVQATFDKPVANFVWQSFMWTSRVLAPAAVAFMLFQGLANL
jgi:NSS family neurotransmitter:Na+ symporter